MFLPSHRSAPSHRLSACAIATAAAGLLLTLPMQAQQPTYYQDVRPVLVENCLRCHDGTGAAWSMTDAEETFTRRRKIAQAIMERHMPPWLAEGGHQEYVGNPMLEEYILKVVQGWRRAATPRVSRWPTRRSRPRRWPHTAAAMAVRTARSPLISRSTCCRTSRTCPTRGAATTTAASWWTGRPRTSRSSPASVRRPGTARWHTILWCSPWRRKWRTASASSPGTRRARATSASAAPCPIGSAIARTARRTRRSIRTACASSTATTSGLRTGRRAWTDTSSPRAPASACSRDRCSWCSCTTTARTRRVSATRDRASTS